MYYALLLAAAQGDNGITDNPALLTLIAAGSAPFFVFVTWLLSRKHTEEIEDSSSLSEAVGAITDANVNIAEVVNSLLAPMQAELRRMAASEKRHNEELDTMRLEMASLQVRFNSIIRYVNILRRQVRDSGMEPAPIPDDLDLSGFNFD